MDVLKKRLARLLMEKSYCEGNFTLTSGRKTDYYFDCKQTALHPEGGWLLGRLFLEMLKGRQVQAVAGMTLGADPLVSATSVLSYVLADQGHCLLPAVIVRKQSKDHGTNKYLEGLANLTPGAPVVLLEDVVTTAGTLLTTIERITEAGLHIAAVLCVLDREEGGSANLAAVGYTLEPIFTRTQLLSASRS
ncbi:Orotate phosphoribosyltransferase [Desulfovibrionales bacterium]